MTDALTTRCRRVLLALDLMPETANLIAEPLTGGVASDIAKVEVGDEIYCIKFALPKLRVEADWYAPVERNYAEYCWLKAVNDIIPEASLKLYGHSAEENGFAMDFISGENSYLLKTALFDGKGTESQANAIGHLLGQIHKASSDATFDTNPFQNRDDFYALRLEPYLVYTAQKHPDICEALITMSEQLYGTQTILIHGDVSPKNIIFDNEQPYLLDAECATMGDPAFDLAFCLNHFILKGLYAPEYRQRYLRLCTAFWTAYQLHISWEEKESLEARTMHLLPMLMLARVDGKSPVEYFNAQQKETCRTLARRLIIAPETLLQQVLQSIAAASPA